MVNADRPQTITADGRKNQQNKGEETRSILHSSAAIWSTILLLMNVIM